uniref:Methionyl-tRNA formyltransferase, mitochondrial n=1 Tax=Anopheles atroparvus TaxID=41427 RepID=A0AAG5DWA2_ANOAO
MYNGRVQSLEVVTSFKAAKNPVKQYSQANAIPVYDWNSFKESPITSFDLGVVVSFGNLIPGAIIRSFDRGMLNVHASLLPKLRGAAPIVHAIANGDKQTGISIMRIKPKYFDVGDILLQSVVNIPRDILMPQLHDQLAQIGASCLITCIEDIERYYHNLIRQDDSQATYAPKIDHKFAEISWNDTDAVGVYNLYRSLYGFRPLSTSFEGELVKIFEMSFNHSQKRTVHLGEHRPGYIEYSKRLKTLLVRCNDGCALEILKLSIGGKKVLTGMDFHNGFLSKVEQSKRYFM